MITSFIANHALDSLWALIWHFGIIGVIMFAALAAAWFIPIARTTSLAIAGVALVIFITAGIYTKLGANYVQAKWNAEQTNEVAVAAKARTDAEASVPPLDSKPHAKRLRNDKFDRDK